jgi:hypothetical protein
MRYALYEHPRTHRFALLRVPSQFVEGDTPASVAADRWFETREAAVAAVPELLNRVEGDDGVPSDSLAQVSKSSSRGSSE